MIKEMFEKYTLPSFCIDGGGEVDTSHLDNGRYLDPVIEDHWQTFQEAVDATVSVCIAEIVLSLKRDSQDQTIFECEHNDILMSQINHLRTLFGAT